jgi:hypothetical protein
MQETKFARQRLVLTLYVNFHRKPSVGDEAYGRTDCRNDLPTMPTFHVVQIMGSNGKRRRSFQNMLSINSPSNKMILRSNCSIRYTWTKEERKLYTFVFVAPSADIPRMDGESTRARHKVFPMWDVVGKGFLSMQFCLDSSIYLSFFQPASVAHFITKASRGLIQIRTPHEVSSLTFL